jgi:hypothetical protein
MAQEPESDFYHVKHFEVPPNHTRWIISMPNVRHEYWTPTPKIRFRPGDVVKLSYADGYVQTGGVGGTCKRYVDPQPADNYYGSIFIPHAMEAAVRIKDAIGQSYTIPADPSVDPDDLFLILGYKDDDYQDNGYWGFDGGENDECLDCSAPPQDAADEPTAHLAHPGGAGIPAWLVLDVITFTPLSPPSPLSILTTDYPAPDLQGPPDWTAAKVGRQTWLENDDPPYEWMPVLDADAQLGINELGIHLTAVSGWAIGLGISDEDVPMTHPFGNDFEFYVAADDKYKHVLGESNAGRNLPPPGQEVPSGQPKVDDEYRKYWHQAGLWNIQTKAGLVGVEIDRDLVPLDFQDLAWERSRTVVLGRWIVDAGHDDFHTEIHPPLLMVFARTEDGAKRTHAKLVGRPFSSSQVFDGSTLRHHLIAEVLKLGAGITFLPSPWASYMIEANPTVLPDLLARSQTLFFDVRPPAFKPSPTAELVANYCFRVRPGVSVEMQAIQADAGGPEGVRITVILDVNRYRMPSLPKSFQVDKDWRDLGDNLLKAMGSLSVIIGRIALNLFKWDFNILFNRGIRTRRFMSPAQPPVLSERETVSWSQLGQARSVGIADGSDDYPYPITGDIFLEWQRAGHELPGSKSGA